MPKFIVNKTFQFAGDIRQAGSVLIISKADLEREKALGKHPTNGKYLSGLLNHCESDDDEIEPEVEKIDEETDRIAEIRAEMDEMGASYDRRWKLSRIENELVMAKKKRGI